MIKVKVCILFSLMLFSCEQPEKEVKDINEILPASKNEYHGETSDSSNSDVLVNYKPLFEKYFAQIDKVIMHNEQLFPDRLRPDTSFKYNLYLGEDTIHYYNWQFQDSTKLKSAFYNWLDVFGDKEVELTPGQSINVQESSFLLFLGDTNLVYIENSTEIKTWVDFLNRDYNQRNWKTIVSQRKRGRTFWQEYIEGKLNKIEN